MPDRTFDFDASYDDVIIDDAARTFVRRLFKKYLWLIVAACIVNIVGFMLVLILPGTSKLTIIGIGILAALGPVFFPWEYFRLPKMLAAPMKQGLKPTATVSISSSSLTVSAKGRSFTGLWTDLKTVLEYSDYFLFVVAPLAFTVIPKKDIPDEAQQLIREVSGLVVRPSLSIQADGQAAADRAR